MQNYLTFLGIKAAKHCGGLLPWIEFTAVCFLFLSHEVKEVNYYKGVVKSQGNCSYISNGQKDNIVTPTQAVQANM